MKSDVEEVLDRLSRAESNIRKLSTRLGVVEKFAHPPLDLPPVVDLVDAVHVLRALEGLGVADRVVLSLSPEGTWSAMTSFSSGFGANLSEAVRNLLSASLPSTWAPTPPGGGNVVHLLYGGTSLCRFTSGVPGDWPRGHSWVGLDQYREGLEADLGEDRLCEACLEKEDD